jgi:hypothetical protein
MRRIQGMILEIGILNKHDMETFPSLFLGEVASAAPILVSRPTDFVGHMQLSRIKETIRRTKRSRRQRRSFSPRTERLRRPKPSSSTRHSSSSASKPLISHLIYFLTRLKFRCIGVFDTVGAIGLPLEISNRIQGRDDILGFSNNDLGEHVELALHALALNETRENFAPMKWHQTPVGRAKNQTLQQVRSEGGSAPLCALADSFIVGTQVWFRYILPRVHGPER